MRSNSVLTGIGVAHARDIGGDGAVAEGDQNARALADQPDLLQILLGADRAFDDRHVDIVRILPRIDQRAVDQIRLGGDRR